MAGIRWDKHVRNTGDADIRSVRKVRTSRGREISTSLPRILPIAAIVIALVSGLLALLYMALH